MTTEAKLKKLEEDQIILEDQNSKLAKVGTPGRLRRGLWRASRARAHGRTPPLLLSAAPWLLPSSGSSCVSLWPLVPGS